MPASESALLRRIAERVHLPRGSGIVSGIGDDCAIFRPRASVEDLLFTTDLLLEGVHFRRESHSASDVGHRALARGLSDIAAMGGWPRFCLLSLAIPPWADDRWIDGFYAGLLKLSRVSGTPLIGGDLSRSETLACDIVVCGAVPRGSALLRGGARLGDSIYVSGLLGGSASGLQTKKGAAWKKHVRIEPRLRLGRYLREKLGATAAMDLSDGISLDLRRLCVASKVSAEIEPPPAFRGATLEQALHGGEDYELLFTVKQGTRVPRTFDGVPLTRIGSIRRGEPGTVLLSGKPLQALGFDHFAKPKS